ncbi:MAG: putative porin, partial [Cyclobacteriaceae bacterium]|nr:putative porin [Cyclobacteriaceae bacterium]
WYHSKNGKYVVLTNYSRNKQEVIEMGGVVLDTLRPERDYFDPQLSEPVLKTAKGIETRNNFHTYQYYKIHKLLRVYHSMDRGRQVNEFFVLPKNEQYAFYDHQELMVENDTVSDKSTFKYFTNEVGGAGVFGKFYYDLFYKIRDIDFNYNHLDSDSLGIPTQFYEFSRGFRAGGSLDSLNYVDLSGEYLNHGFYKINGDVTSEWVDVSVKKSLWEPAYMERGYQGHYDFWHNEFRAMSALQGEAALKVKVKGLLFKPGVRYTAINDNIFFRKQSFNDSTLVDSVGLQQVLPVQADSVSTIFSPGIELKYTLSNITLTTRATYSILNKHAEEGVPTPKIFLYGQLAYHNIFFKGNLELHAGIDLHWRSSYYAPMYDPLIQQFYVQDEYEWKNYWMMNVFINAKISKVRTFIRLNNIRMNFNDVGYYALPMYPGVNNILDVGFDWKFYD